MILATTGHRPDKLGGYDASNPIRSMVMEQIDRALLRLRPTTVIVGMALGVDQWMAELCIWNQIPFVAALPFEDFHTRWPFHAQVKFREILSKAQSVHIVSPGAFSGFKMQLRNEWMVDHCEHLLAIWDGTPGGTANCVGYAERVGKPITRLNPDDFIQGRRVVGVERTEGVRAAPIILRRAGEVLREVRVETVQVRQEETPGQRAAIAEARRRRQEEEEELAALERQRQEARERRRQERAQLEAEALVKSQQEEARRAEEQRLKEEQEQRRLSSPEFGRILDL